MKCGIPQSYRKALQAIANQRWADRQRQLDFDRRQKQKVTRRTNQLESNS